MPIIRSAKKKLRQDIKKTKRNNYYKIAYEKAMHDIKKIGKDKAKATLTLKKAYSQIDKAVKKRIIHKNKAARLKSRVAKLVSK